MNCLEMQCPLSSGGATIYASYPVIRLYYYAGSQRIAMRQGTTLRFLLGDHLGSTALTVSSTGAKVGEFYSYTLNNPVTRVASKTRRLTCYNGSTSKGEEL
jgi:hypothetical protein